MLAAMTAAAPSAPNPTPATTPAIEVHGLSKTYRRRGGETRALDGLDLSIPRGGVHALLGPNGSGKTTLIRVLLGLTPAAAGSWSLLGVPQPAGLQAVINEVGAIVEQPKFFPHFTARQMLRLLADAIGAPASRIDTVLAQVGLHERGNDRIKAYSLGMKQRLAIATTLLKEPELFIFDEPTNGLDPAGIHEVRSTIRRLGDEGRTVLLSSHLLSEVQQVADTVSIVERGHLVRAGRVDELLAGAQRGVRVSFADPYGAAQVLIAAGFSVERLDQHRMAVTGEGVTAQSVNQLLTRHDLWADEIAPHTPDLEQVFLQLTRGAAA